MSTPRHVEIELLAEAVRRLVQDSQAELSVVPYDHFDEASAVGTVDGFLRLAEAALLTAAASLGGILEPPIVVEAVTYRHYPLGDVFDPLAEVYIEWAFVVENEADRIRLRNLVWARNNDPVPPGEEAG